MPRDLSPGGVTYMDDPPPFAPKPVRREVNLEELARQIELEGRSPMPLKGVAEAIVNLKFHDLMEMANAIGPPRDTMENRDPNYQLAASLNAWALAQLK